MPILRLNDIQLNFGTQVLFDNIELTIAKKQRIGLVGRNGAGKSTFLKLLAGKIQADSGERWQRPGTRIAYLDQELPSPSSLSVFDFVALGLGDTGQLLKEFHLLTQSSDASALKKLDNLQQKIDAADGWQFEQKIASTLSQFELDPNELMQNLSGGWRRRAALAQALISEPDLLLLDEPTNHLDIPKILWLEDLLKNFQQSFVLITHDREFLQQVAEQIIELDRGHLSIWNGDYKGFLNFREQQLAAEEKANSEFDKKLAQEEVWIRQGIKARRTRNEGRVRALKKMREERSNRREQQGKANLQIEQASDSGKIVVEAETISKQFNDGAKTVIPPFSVKILRGDRVGIVGTNGAGKSTLLKILLGELTPDTGTVKLGSNLQIAYFDQLRASLDPEKTVIDNIAFGREFITINGKSRHIISYLQDFLFAPERTRQPVKALSGGEQNRLILAQLFSKPANLLVLDEPTNDLDIETLELLEELLTEFSGTVLLVSHDREFLDNVVSSIIVFEEDGALNEYVGGYADYLQRKNTLKNLTSTSENTNNATASRTHAQQPSASDENKAQTKKKLSYKLQRELDQLPDQIEKLEQEIADLESKTAEADFYQREQDVVTTTLQSLTDKQQNLDTLLERWTELESLAGN